MGRRAVRTLVAGVLLVGATGCASRDARTLKLSVFAASSLTEAFRALEQQFEAEHPNVDVRLTFAGSQVLRLQIEQGARADVFASANKAHMRALVGAGLVNDGGTFARNALTMIVPLTPPSPILDFSALPKAQRIVMGSKHVPIGMYTETILERGAEQFGRAFATEVHRRIVSRESNVRLVTAKVALGEADAAIVYRTDAAASMRVRSVPIPDALNVEADYLIGAVVGSRRAELARKLIEHIHGPAGQAILARHGFVKS